MDHEGVGFRVEGVDLGGDVELGLLSGRVGCSGWGGFWACRRKRKRAISGRKKEDEKFRGGILGENDFQKFFVFNFFYNF